MEANLKKFGFKPFLAKKRALTPWDFGENFKFAKTFGIRKRTREIMFGGVFRVLGSRFKENWFLAVFGQKAWTNPLGFLIKFQICSNFLYR